MRLFTLSINGELTTVAAPSQSTLLEVLRYHLRLTGTKQGCDKGDCGACTVLIDGQPMLACCTLSATCEGKSVTTIEGLATAKGLSDVQQAFVDSGALQCGFCQPGMMISATALLAENPTPSLHEIKVALSGNLCRCTGYTKIYQAVQMAAKSIKRGPPTPAPGFHTLGSRAQKPDAVQKADGSALFTDDIQLPRMAVGKILRSPHAHARIRSISVDAALAIPGVLAVATGKDLPRAYCVIPWTRDETAMCIDTARYVGDAVACIAAINIHSAEAGLKAIEVDYEPLPAVFDPQEALAEDAPLVHERDWKDRPRKSNLCKSVSLDFGDVDQALKDAHVVIDDHWDYAGNTHAAIEPHCAIARWSPDGKLTLWSATQVGHYLHRELAASFDLPQSKVRVIQPMVGGGFGGKSEPFDLEFCSALLAQKCGRPVKILYTREEVFYAHRGRHPMRFHMKVAANKEGLITAVDNDILIDGGAYHSFGLVTTYYAGQLLAGPLHFGAYRYASKRVYTNKPCCGPKRGHGSVQPRFPLETALDQIADALSLDPIELRRRNAAKSGDTTINGFFIPSCGILECLDKVEEASGWIARHSAMPSGRGLGVATSMYISGTAYPIYPNKMPQSGVQLRADRSGRITVFCGSNDIGQGSDAMLAMVVSEETGVPLDDITVISGDTELTPVDLGSYSSRVTYMAGTAAREAGAALKKQLVESAAKRWSCAPDEVIIFAGGLSHHTDPSLQISSKQALIWAEEDHGTLGATGSYTTREVGGDYRGGTIGASPAYSATAHVAEVSVDIKTGVVKVLHIWAAHDCGRALNPEIVEGQIEGSVYMGMSESLFEDMRYRDTSGLHMGPNLLDYRIATTLDTPDISALIVESIDPGGPHGAKEAGEGPLHPAIPAIANAIRHATGAQMRSLPFTPERVLAAIKQAQERSC